MGYTHAFEINDTDPAYAAAWPGLATDARQILTAVRALGIVIAGPLGTGDVVDDDDGIRFNGDAETDDDCETFWLPTPATTGPRTLPPRSYCKTNRNPYDLAVAGILLRARLLLPGVVQLHSNGSWDEEWARGAYPHPSIPGSDVAPRQLITDLFGPIPDVSPFDEPDYCF
ncbi:hypothetical protein [Hamadaea tsunoensis]|uniref:hypothetical protein n=1 Tax=Hamadaea tsunoensis TaxID=53368 RepID=UPI0004047425|nr:hypothetical protein [Hamadaea tsunoensis]